MKIANVRARDMETVCMFPWSLSTWRRARRQWGRVVTRLHPATIRKSMLGMFESLRKSVPHDAWDDLPTDFAKNKKHYLYGFPKEAN